MTRPISPYPWSALERLDRAVLAQLRRARQRVARSVNIAELARAASEVLETRVSLRVSPVCSRAEPLQGAVFAFEDGQGGEVAIELPFALVSHVLSCVLRRKPPVCRLDGFIDPALLGATHALLAEIVRRTRAELPLRIRKALPARGSHFALEAVVTLDGMPFDARLWLDASDRPSSGVPARSLHELGSLPVSLTLVAALSLAKRDELAELEPGDAWLPGEGWLCDARGHGTLILVGAAGLDGASARLSESGELVLVGARMSLAPDGEQTMAEIDQAESGALANAVLDAPVVVRVEVGAVTLSAREWAELRPGDVIETGRRIADVVSLRVGGREVARGELVNVEGQLGVRIRELSTDDGGP